MPSSRTPEKRYTPADSVTFLVQRPTNMFGSIPAPGEPSVQSKLSVSSSRSRSGGVVGMWGGRTPSGMFQYSVCQGGSSAASFTLG